MEGLEDLIAMVESFKGPASDLADIFQSLKGSAGGLTDTLKNVGGGLADLGPEGMAAGAAVGVLAAVAATTVGVLLGLSAAAVSVIQQREGLLATFSALGSGEAAGRRTLAMVDKLSASLPYAKEQIAQWAQGLMRAGITGRELESATKAVAAAGALNPMGGAEAATRVLTQLAMGGQGAMMMVKGLTDGSGLATRKLKEMGLTQADITKQLKAMGVTGQASAVQMGHAIETALQAKGSGRLDQMMSTFPAMLAHLKDGFASLFTGLSGPVDAFMGTVRGLFDQFNEGTGAMGALRSVATEALGTIFKYATMAVAAISSFVRENFTAGNVTSTWASIKQAIAGLLDFLSPLIAHIKQVAQSQSFMRGLSVAWTVLKVTIGAVAAVIATVAVAIVATMADIIQSTGEAVDAFEAIWNAVSSFSLSDTIAGWVASLDGLTDGAFSAAGNFVMGLVDGITSGASAVAAAVANLARSALSTFTGIFGIHSPSRVMLEHGEDNIAGAAATGIEDGAPRVERAMTKLSPKVGAPGAQGGAGARGGAGASGGRGRAGPFNFNNCTFGSGMTQATVEEMFRAAAEKFFGEEGAAGPEPVGG